MSLNIKNAETTRVIRELATLTGEGQTLAVEIAVRERLDRLQRARNAERTQRIDDLIDKMAPVLKGMPDHGDLLYDDETGLPK